MPKPILAVPNMLVPTANIENYNQDRYPDSAGVIINYILADLSKSGRNVLVLKSGTGTGKSTYLLSEMYLKLVASGKNGNIVATQPAIANPPSIVEGIIEHGNGKFHLGENIGYITGGPKEPTKGGIKVVTTAILMLELMNNTPEEVSRRYDAIFVDEVHKSSSELESLLRLLKRASMVEGFPPIVLMSGTLNEIELFRFFKLDPVNNYIEVKGGFSFDMTVVYPDYTIKDYDVDVLKTIDFIMKDGTTEEDKRLKAGQINPDGSSGYKPYLRYGQKDTMIFVNSAASIDNIAENVERKWPKKVLNVKIMGNTLRDKGKDYENLQRTLTPQDAPLELKLIAATNAVETGITIDGLVYCIDSGMTKEMAYNPHHKSKTLLDKPIDAFSKAQRQGRVARAMDGCFLPLYSKRVEDSFSKESYSKLVTEDCTRFILSVLVTSNPTPSFDSGSSSSSGAAPMSFQDLVFMDLRQRIPIQNITNALRCLYHWGLIDQDMQVTQIGRMLNELPRVTTEVGTFILHMLQYTNIHFDDILILGAFLENPKMLIGLTRLDYNKGDFEFVGMKKTYSKVIGNPMFDFLCGFITIEDLWVADILGSTSSGVSVKAGVLDTILKDLRLDRKTFGNFLALVALLRENFYKIGAATRVDSNCVRFSTLSSIQCVSYFNQVTQVIKGLSTRDEFHYNASREKWVCTSTGMEIYLPATDAKRVYLPSYIVMGNGRTKKYDIVTDLIIKV